MGICGNIFGYRFSNKKAELLNSFEEEIIFNAVKMIATSPYGKLSLLHLFMCESYCRDIHDLFYTALSFKLLKNNRRMMRPKRVKGVVSNGEKSILVIIDGLLAVFGFTFGEGNGF